MRNFQIFRTPLTKLIKMTEDNFGGIINGKEIAKYRVFATKPSDNHRRNIRDGLKAEVESLKPQGICPHLAIMQVGHRQDSSAYVSMKEKAALEVFCDHLYDA